MGTLIYQKLFEKVNQYILAESFDSIENDQIQCIITEMMNHAGKRVRPVLCCMANSFFAPMTPNILLASLAIELFHNFSLVHDDIMDKAPLRRDKPTLYQRYGIDHALLIGDVMLIEVYAILNKIEHQDKADIVALFNKTAKDICIGQFLDISQANTIHHSSTWTFDTYMHMIKLKTAVLIGTSLQLGAIIGGAERKLTKALYDIGVLMGILFQIQDDFLDVFGKSEAVGKQMGGDILEGKKTILYFKAMEKLSPIKQEKLKEFMNSPHKDTHTVTEVFELYKDAGVETTIKYMQEQNFNEIRMNIQSLPLHEKAQQDLEEMAFFLFNRIS